MATQHAYVFCILIFLPTIVAPPPPRTAATDLQEVIGLPTCSVSSSVIMPRPPASLGSPCGPLLHDLTKMDVLNTITLLLLAYTNGPDYLRLASSHGQTHCGKPNILPKISSKQACPAMFVPKPPAVRPRRGNALHELFVVTYIQTHCYIHGCHPNYNWADRWVAHGLWPVYPWGTSMVYCDLGGVVGGNFPIIPTWMGSWFALWCASNDIPCNQLFWEFEYQKHGTCTTKSRASYANAIDNLYQRLDIDGIFNMANLAGEGQQFVNNDALVTQIALRIGVPNVRCIIVCKEFDGILWLYEIRLCTQPTSSPNPFFVNCDPRMMAHNNCPVNLRLPFRV